MLGRGGAGGAKNVPQTGFSGSSSSIGGGGDGDGVSHEGEGGNGMAVVLPDRYGVIRDPYYVATQSTYGDARGWLSNSRLVASPKTRRSVATRLFLINHGELTNDKARRENVLNCGTFDGGMKSLKRRVHKEEKREHDESYKRVLDSRLFDGCVGNGYALLRMAKSSSNPEKWLFRARQLAHAICDRTQTLIPHLAAVDFHLGDGYGGLLCFLIDVLNPHSDEAGFPIFE